jgi:hypothetical protein
MKKVVFIVLLMTLFGVGAAAALHLPTLYTYYSGSKESTYQLEQLSFTADGLEFGTEPITF